MWKQIQQYQGMRHRALSDFNSQSIIRIGELLYQSECHIAQELKLMRGKYGFNLQENQVKYTPPSDMIRDWIPTNSIKYLSGTTRINLIWLTEEEVLEKYADIDNITPASNPVYWSYHLADQKILILPPVATTDSIKTQKIPCDSLDDWNSTFNALSLDTSDKKEGTSSLKITIDRATFVNNPIAGYDFTSTNLLSWHSIGFWLRSSQYIPKNNIGMGFYSGSGTKYVWVHVIDFDICPNQWYWIQTEIQSTDTASHLHFVDFNSWTKHHGGGATDLTFWLDDICEVQPSQSSIIIENYVRFPHKPRNYYSSVLNPTQSISVTQGSNRIVFTNNYTGYISVGDYIGICSDQYGRECPSDDRMYKITYLDADKYIVIDRP